MTSKKYIYVLNNELFSQFLFHLTATVIDQSHTVHETHYCRGFTSVNAKQMGASYIQ